MTASPSLVIVGDALLDRDIDGRATRLSPDAPVPVVDAGDETARPGGAGLAALLAARDGLAVTLVTAIGDDAAGARLRELLAGIDVIDLGLDGPTPEKIRICAGGRPLVRLDRGAVGAAPVGTHSADARAAIAWGDAVLVSDYGGAVTAVPALRAALAEAPGPVVWDPHPRGTDPVAGATLVTPNEGEARAAAGTAPGEEAQAAELLARRWRSAHVAVTCGARGAVLTGAGPTHLIPAVPASGDPCGAGDRFAVAAAGALAGGADAETAVRTAVRVAGAFVAAGGAAAVGRAGPQDPAAGSAEAVIARTRAAGGRVVATGGCFDLLHAGHVQTLTAARALGDCLVVCLNADVSVRRLKGAGRPVVAEADRAAVLAALRCVDAVEIFSEDTPSQVLERLRPDVWAKGGDYADVRLPEAEVLERWGGRAVVLPHLDGRSTTNLVEKARLHAVG